MPSNTLIVPGLKSSGALHWQTWLEHRVPGSFRVHQRDWTDPHLPDWSSRIRSGIARVPGRIFIVAHSFGALASVQAASDYEERIGGVLLVAPADPGRFGIAEYLPEKPLRFPAIVVASTNDPWMRFESAAYWARRWDAQLINLGRAGHINVEAGYGPWPEALNLLDRLRREAEFRDHHQRDRAFHVSQNSTSGGLAANW
jgi:predicted alpha/beta hydrolase family esterase